MKRYTLISLFIILALGFVVRLYHFSGPIADWHSWRQADTASVTRNFVKEGFVPLWPKFNIYNSLNEGSIPNPNRYFLAEFPIYNSFQYFGFTYIGQLTLEEWGRLVSIIAATLTVLFLYLLVSLYSSRRVAMLSSLFFAVLPFNIYFGRTIMPDTLHVLFAVMAIYFVALWTKKNKDWASLLAGLAMGASLLTKPYSLVLFLPIAFLILYSWPFKFLKKWSFYVFAFISLVPFILWRIHIGQHPEGMFATSWLYNGGDIRFTGAFFRWLIFDRMNRLIFATGGFALFIIGIIRGYEKKQELMYYLWLLSIGVFFVVIAKGSVTHDYYQLPLVPIGCIFMAKGFDFLISYGRDRIQRFINIILAVGLFLIMLAFGWFEVRGYFNINNPAIVEAGQKADEILPKNAKVIAPYQLDSAFLYQTNRNGWTVGATQIPKFIKEGATTLVTLDFNDYTNYWMQKCSVLFKNDRFVIVDLKKCSDTSNPPI